MNKEEKEKRHTLLRSLLEKERSAFMASLPASADDIRNLFDYIDTGEACDNTLRRTTEFIQMKGLDLDRILRWLKENGGYCDCEVVFNVEDAWTRHAGPEYQRD